MGMMGWGDSEGPCASGLAAPPRAGPRGPRAQPSAPIMLYIIYVTDKAHLYSIHTQWLH